jgi:E3 ubiquitin-protein ligase CHFR
VANIQSQPRGFAPLIELELFVDVHAVASGIDPDPGAARTRICRVCATEVLLWGLRDWWIRERQKGFLQEHILSRKDCPDGNGCGRQNDLGMFPGIW